MYEVFARTPLAILAFDVRALGHGDITEEEIDFSARPSPPPPTTREMALVRRTVDNYFMSFLIYWASVIHIVPDWTR